MLLIDLCILICWQIVDPLRRTVEEYSLEVRKAFFSPSWSNTVCALFQYFCVNLTGLFSARKVWLSNTGAREMSSLYCRVSIFFPCGCCYFWVRMWAIAAFCAHSIPGCQFQWETLARASGKQALSITFILPERLLGVKEILTPLYSEKSEIFHWKNAAVLIL